MGIRPEGGEFATVAMLDDTPWRDAVFRASHYQEEYDEAIVYVGLDVHKRTILLAARSSLGGTWLLEKVFDTQDLSKLRKARNRSPGTAWSERAMRPVGQDFGLNPCSRNFL